MQIVFTRLEHKESHKGVLGARLYRTRKLGLVPLGPVWPHISWAKPWRSNVLPVRSYSTAKGMYLLLRQPCTMRNKSRARLSYEFTATSPFC